MVVEPIGTLAELEALVPEWESLWARCPAATPFQHPAWLLPWREVFSGGELFSFAVRDGGRLVALAPMFLHPWNGRRQVTFLGNGVSDRLDLLAEQELAGDAWTAISHGLWEERDRWDLCDLQDLADTSALVANAGTEALQSAVRPQYHCSAIQLPCTVECFQAQLSHGLRRNLRRYRTHLEQQGAVSFSTVQSGDFEEHLEAFFTLHCARWREKGETGMLDDPSLQSFHRIAARGLWEREMVRLHALRLDERIIAIVYALVRGHRAYSYLGGFNSSLARFSPGALIMGYTIDQAILEGVKEFDFLRGRESYKTDWGAKPSLSSRLLLWHAEPPVDLLNMAVQ